jgi:RNA 2',3'-cyclic 3'-phosphodiesterase
VFYINLSGIENPETRRLFFGAQVHAAWPEELPPGRLIAEDTRHITLAFLGDSHLKISEFPQIPKPAFLISPVGIGNQLLFLPRTHARVVALDVEWLTDPHPLLTYQQTLVNWLDAVGHNHKGGSFSAHISIARAPFEKKAWQESFQPIPFFLSHLHLYESLGHLDYRALWSHPLTKPFIELEHTADLAFEICGASLAELAIHAHLALFFAFPPLIEYYRPIAVGNLETLIMHLNKVIAECDRDRGCCFKAVSFHGSIREQNGLYYWEMIIDV